MIIKCPLLLSLFVEKIILQSCKMDSQLFSNAAL